MNDDFFKMTPKKTHSNDEVLKPDAIEMPGWGKITPYKGGQVQPVNAKEEIVRALTDKDNINRILNIVDEIVSIQKTKELTKAQVTLLEQRRKTLQEETDAYVRKLRESTNGQIEKAKSIERLMSEFYQKSDGKLSSADFKAIIDKVIDNVFKDSNQQSE